MIELEEQISGIKVLIEKYHALLDHIPSLKHQDWIALSEVSRLIQDESYAIYLLLKDEKSKQHEMAWAFEWALRLSHAQVIKLWIACFADTIHDEKPEQNGQQALHDNEWIAFLNGSWRQGLSLLQSKALDGHPGSQYYLGQIYDKGLGVEKDAHQAFEWYEKAALQGHALAQFTTANMYNNGCGVLKNDAMAFEWYEKAALQGNAYAQINLAGMYHLGQSIAKNHEMALEWCEKAALQGVVTARNNMAVMYKELGARHKDLGLQYDELGNRQNKNMEAKYYFEQAKNNLIKAKNYFRLAAEYNHCHAELLKKSKSPVAHYHLAMLERKKLDVVNLLKMHTERLLPIIDEFEFKEFFNLSSRLRLFCAIEVELKKNEKNKINQKILSHLALGFCNVILNHHEEHVVAIKSNLVSYFTQVNPVFFTDQWMLSHLLFALIHHWYYVTSVDTPNIAKTHEEYARCVVYALYRAKALSLPIEANLLKHLVIILLKSRYPNAMLAVSLQSINLQQVMKLLVVSEQGGVQRSLDDVIKCTGISLVNKDSDITEEDNESVCKKDSNYVASLSMFSLNSNTSKQTQENERTISQQSKLV